MVLRRIPVTTLLVLLMAPLSLILPLRAEAHPVAQGSIRVVRTDHAVDMTMRASFEQVTVQQSARTDISDADPSPSQAEQWQDHGRYILKHLRVEADGAVLAGIPYSEVPPTEEGPFVTYRFIFPFEAPPTKLTMTQNILNEILFAPGNPWEATFVVSTESAESTPALLVPQTPLVIELAAPTPGTQVSQAVLFRDFLKHGIHHILIGYDHLLFASALVLSTLIFWDVIKVIFTFTLAHTVTLALAALNIIRLPSNIVEPLIALSIVVVAAINLNPKHRPNFRSVIPLAFFFGLFHGLGFAGGLLDAMENLPSLHFWTALTGFSVGVEIGHQAVVLPLFVLLLAVRTIDARRQTNLAQILVRVLALLITCGGVYFLVNTL